MDHVFYLVGVVPFAGAMFCAYELIERAWRKPKSSMTPAENFMNGCIAAAIAQTASHPFDTIRKKLQVSNQNIIEKGYEHNTFAFACMHHHGACNIFIEKFINLSCLLIMYV